MEKQPGARRMSALRAIAHPVRLRILSLLTGTEMSAAEISRELGITHANASYHLRFLAEAGEVVEAGEERIRGGLAKRYRHPWDPQERGEGRAAGGAAAATAEERAVYIRAMAQELERRFAMRKQGTPSALTDAELWVTPKVWAQVTALVAKASTLIHAEAKSPRAKGTVHVNMTAAVFEMTDPRGDHR
jgi:DNA-binding transcriptional ArsR family regulator